MKISEYDIYKILSIVGGVPWYLEQFDAKITVDENIKNLAFDKDGVLVEEFDRIFHDLFNGKGETYKRIMESLKTGSKTLAEIRKSIEFSHSGTLSQMMSHLITAGFVVKQPLWSFKTKKSLKQSLYRISDPYMRFYLKVIKPSLDAIVSEEFDKVPLSAMVGFDVHMGLQLETMLLQNRSMLINKLGISPVDIVRSGPYRQSNTTTQRGCQIDYLVQTRTNSLYICEFKFKWRELKSDIISEMQDKVARVKCPKGFAKVPVLFHVSGVSTEVGLSPFFYRVFDLRDFLDDVDF